MEALRHTFEQQLAAALTGVEIEAPNIALVGMIEFL